MYLRSIKDRNEKGGFIITVKAVSMPTTIKDALCSKRRRFIIREVNVCDARYPILQRQAVFLIFTIENLAKRVTGLVFENGDGKEYARKLKNAIYFARIATESFTVKWCSLRGSNPKFKLRRRVVFRLA